MLSSSVARKRHAARSPVIEGAMGALDGPTGEHAVPRQTLVDRVDTLEARVTNPEQLPARFDELTSQFSQFRTEVRAELSAVRIEIREPGQTLHVEMQEPYAWLDAGVRLRARDTVVR